MYERDDIINNIDEFLKLYEQRPIKNNEGGGLSVNMFELWYALKTLEPRYVIESGVFQGQGTWLIEKTLPYAKIICIEPAYGQILYKSKNAKYLTQDFLTLTNEHISKVQAKNTLVYFDDHQNAYTRLLHCHELGFKHILFDDNHPEYRGKRHLTLEACLNNKADPGFIIPNNAKENLLKIIESYHICQPLFKYADYITMEKSLIEIPAIFEFEEPLDQKYETIYKDMHNYRWATYVGLKTEYTTQSVQPTKDEDWSHMIYDWCESNIKPGFVCIDAGAYTGYITKKLARLAGPTGMVYAFEICPESYNEMVNNTKHLCNVKPLLMAVSNKNEKIKCYKMPHTSICWNTIGYDVNYNKIDADYIIDSVSLDEYFKDAKQIDFIKIDVEGAEDEVLEGCINIMRKHKPTMLIEYHLDEKYNYKILIDNGYTIHKLYSMEELHIGDKRCYQVLALPKNE